MRQIKLSTGELAAVSEEWFDYLNQFSWHLNQHGYAYRYDYTDWRKKKKVFMSREIMSAVKGQIVDHIDRNRLNNFLSNLRFVTVSESTKNKGKHKSNATSKYKGVYEGNGGWMVDVDNQYRGTFRTEIEAAQASDYYARKFHQDFAVLNFPEIAQDEQWIEKNRKHLRTSPETIAKVKEMKASGSLQAEIMQTCDLSRYTVYKILHNKL